jgi:hypothetical protein
MLTGLVLAVMVGGCAHAPTVSEADRTAIYQRATVQFDQTVLVKPQDSVRPEFKFAPLLVQEILSTNQAPAVPYSVYFWSTRARAGGRVLDQFNYLWFHRGNPSRPKMPQGVRITFNPDGQPILWEILRDPSGARILFVSQSLEAAAMTNRPAPLPGRRFWVERAVEEVPDVVVARVLDDAPAPMGPIVYLESGSHDVGTVICRCMDAQAREVVGMGTYGLATLDDAAVRWLSREKTPGLTRWLPGMPPDDVERWLRATFP